MTKLRIISEIAKKFKSKYSQIPKKEISTQKELFEEIEDSKQIDLLKDAKVTDLGVAPKVDDKSRSGRVTARDRATTEGRTSLTDKQKKQTIRFQKQLVATEAVQRHLIGKLEALIKKGVMTKEEAENILKSQLANAKFFKNIVDKPGNLKKLSDKTIREINKIVNQGTVINQDTRKILLKRINPKTGNLYTNKEITALRSEKTGILTKQEKQFGFVYPANKEKINEAYAKRKGFAGRKNFTKVEQDRLDKKNNAIKKAEIELKEMVDGFKKQNLAKGSAAYNNAVKKYNAKKDKINKLKEEYKKVLKDLKEKKGVAERKPQPLYDKSELIKDKRRQFTDPKKVLDAASEDAKEAEKQKGQLLLGTEGEVKSDEVLYKVIGKDGKEKFVDKKTFQALNPKSPKFIKGGLVTADKYFKRKVLS